MPATFFLEHASFTVSMPSEDFCHCNDAVKKSVRRILFIGGDGKPV